jgi:hypothetical protein
LENYRAMLCPLRFGAGIKGKIAESWSHGLPVVTTEIGAEGMMLESSGTNTEIWGGLHGGMSAVAVAQDSLQLYSDALLWVQSQKQGFRILDKLFLHKHNSKAFVDLNIADALRTLEERRAGDTLQSMLWHESVNAADYKTRWITAKQSLSAVITNPPHRN